MNGSPELGGSPLETKKLKYMEGEGRRDILKLPNVLRHESFFQKLMHPYTDDEALYNLDSMYTGAEGDAFTVVDSSGRINGFLSLRKTTEEGLVIDQLRINPQDSGVSTIAHSLVQKAIDSLQKKGMHSSVSVLISDASEFQHVFTDMGFEREGKEGDRIVLRLRV